MTRICKKCGAEKDLTPENFRPYQQRQVTYLRVFCRGCEKGIDRDRRYSDPQQVARIRAYQVNWGRKNREKIRALARQKRLESLPPHRRERLEYLRANRKWLAEESRKWKLRLLSNRCSQHLLFKYGLTVDGYDSLLERQARGCAICGKPSADKAGRPLHVDHCHATGRVRGLLCMDCNTSIGKMQDSPELLLRASEYLLSH